MTDESPNAVLDKRIKKMLTDADNQPLDVQVKVVNAAISWEKVKHCISDKDKDPFNPDDI